MYHFIKKIAPAAMAAVVFLSCTESRTDIKEEKQISSMDSTTKAMDQASKKLDEQTKKVEASLEKLEAEFDSTK